MKGDKAMKFRNTAAALLAAAMCLVSACGSNTAAPADGTQAETEQTPAVSLGEMRDMTTQEIVRDMGMGINLGNTFEATGGAGTTVQSFETMWGSPVVTQPLIQGYADAGFGVMRLPVAWSNLMADDYTISPELLARIDEVTGWAVDSGLYVIMNIHWDGGWWEKFPTEKEECMKKYTRIWEQLCSYYGKYGDKLMFESLNEEGGWESIWNRYSGTAGEEKEQSYALLNEINQKFVDIVRASGGNNEKRHLLIAGYNTDVDLTCDELFVMPEDPAGRCAVSVHYYTPSTFCLLEKDASWGKAKKTWGHEKEVKEMEDNMDKLKTRFVDNGIPVIMGEYGCVAVRNKEPDVVRRFNLCAAQSMYTRGICPVLWDIKGLFYDRYFFTMKDEEFMNGLKRIEAGEDVMSEELAAYEKQREEAREKKAAESAAAEAAESSAAEEQPSADNAA